MDYRMRLDGSACDNVLSHADYVVHMCLLKIACGFFYFTCIYLFNL